MGKLSKDRRDVYYRRAKEEGYRARSAYKLLQLDDQLNIFGSIDFSNGGFRAVDLCAAPGSWSQVISRRLTMAYKEARQKGHCVSPPLIVAVDLQKMSPIDGVIQIQGDITSKETAQQVLSHFGGNRANVVVCDGAPDVTGMHDIDEYIQSQLLFAAMRMAVMLLEPGATFIAKMFRGETSGLQYSQLNVFFNEIYSCKPASSRVSSFEAFVVCRGFRYPLGFEPSRFLSHLDFQEAVWNCVANSNPLLHSIENSNDSEDPIFKYLPSATTEDKQKQCTDKGALLIQRLSAATVPFIACGDLSGFDSDTTYCLKEGHIFKEPHQPPINPPYKEAVEAKRFSATTALRNP